MSNWFSNMFSAGGNGQAPGALYSGSGDAPSTFNALEAGADPKLQEKGSILGMTPSTFASIAGQLGSAISPKDSWQSKLGNVAAQMGSQKLGQLMQAEKERRAGDLWKQILKQADNKQLTTLTSGLANTGITKTYDDQFRDYTKALGGDIKNDLSA